MTTKILLIDDDIDDSELFIEALAEVDSSVVCDWATDGLDALGKLKQQEEPDIIFLDINMPGMDGWECLTNLKNDDSFKHIPVVLYSTSSHQTEVKTAFDLGALSFLSKPYDYKDLKMLLSFVVANLKRGSLDAIRQKSV